MSYISRVCIANQTEICECIKRGSSSNLCQVTKTLNRLHHDLPQAKAKRAQKREEKYQIELQLVFGTSSEFEILKKLELGHIYPADIMFAFSQNRISKSTLDRLRNSSQKIMYIIDGGEIVDSEDQFLPGFIPDIETYGIVNQHPDWFENGIVSIEIKKRATLIKYKDGSRLRVSFKEIRYERPSLKQLSDKKLVYRRHRASGKLLPFYISSSGSDNLALYSEADKKLKPKINMSSAPRFSSELDFLSKSGGMRKMYDVVVEHVSVDGLSKISKLNRLKLRNPNRMLRKTALDKATKANKIVAAKQTYKKKIISPDPIKATSAQHLKEVSRLPKPMRNLLKSWEKKDFLSHVKGIWGSKGHVKKLRGGLHSHKGLEEFIAQTGHQPISKEYLDNGVLRVVFSNEATNKSVRNLTKLAEKNNSGISGGKTIFPETWSTEKIFNAAKSVKKSGRVIRGRFEQYEGIFYGVKMRVSFNSHGNIISAYPTWIQL